MIAQTLLAFCGALAFAVLMGVPRPHLLPGAACGGLAWAVYLVVTSAAHLSVPVGAIVGAFVAALCAELAARWRKTPATLFLVPGIIPLVPGLWIYNAMFRLVSGHTVAALNDAATALLIGTGITGGIAAVAILRRALRSLGLS